MTASMKFNKKVYVIPEEKYINMLENCKNRERVDDECESIRHRPPLSTNSGEGEESKFSTLRSSSSDLVGGPKQNSRGKKERPSEITDSGPSAVSDDSNDSSKRSSTRSKVPSPNETDGLSANGRKTERKRNNDGDSGGDRELSQKILLDVQSELDGRELKRNVGTIHKILMGNARKKIEGRNKSDNMGTGGVVKLLGLAKDNWKNYKISLLHTQSDKFPTPLQYKTFYYLLLRKGVPLKLISNKRLRRVLHYLKFRGLGRSERGPRNIADVFSGSVQSAKKISENGTGVLNQKKRKINPEINRDRKSKRERAVSAKDRRGRGVLRVVKKGKSDRVNENRIGKRKTVKVKEPWIRI